MSTSHMRIGRRRWPLGSQFRHGEESVLMYTSTRYLGSPLLHYSSSANNGFFLRVSIACIIHTCRNHIGLLRLRFRIARLPRLYAFRDTNVIQTTQNLRSVHPNTFFTTLRRHKDVQAARVDVYDDDEDDREMRAGEAEDVKGVVTDGSEGWVCK